MVVGNKKDLEENRMIEMMDAAKFAQENGISINLTLLIDCLFMETSAMTGENVEEVFNKLTNTLIYKIDSGEIPEEFVMTNKQVTSISSH